MTGMEYEDTYEDCMETKSVPKCRICWREDGELISPCKCEGSQAFVHYNCLLDKIETARIMKVATMDGCYNSRCSLCKCHIQFKIEEQRWSLSSMGIKKAFKSLDEDTAACLTLNLPIIVALFAILMIIVTGHVRYALKNGEVFNYKFVLLEILLLTIEYFLIRNVRQRFPYKIRKPVLIDFEEITY